MRKILGLNTEFESLKYDGFQENRFSSSISLLDYDAVVIDVGFLADAYQRDGVFQNKKLLTDYSSHQILEDFSIIKGQLIELLKQGRTLFLLMGKMKTVVFLQEKNSTVALEKMPAKQILLENWICTLFCRSALALRMFMEAD